MLLDPETKIQTTDAVGKTALDWAEETGLKRMRAVLESHTLQNAINYHPELEKTTLCDY